MQAPTGTSRFRSGISLLAILVSFCLVSPATAGKKKQAEKKKISTQFKLAQTYYDNDRFGEALGKVNEILKLNSKYLQAHQLKGQILFSMEEIEGAIIAFDQVLRLDKKYTEARNWKAFALVQLERYEEAMDEYDEALLDLTYPTPEKIHLNKGMLYRLIGDNENAITTLEEAVRLNPSYVRAFYELGVTHSDLGNKDKAKRYFESVIKLNPGGYEASLARDRLAELRAAS